MPTAYMSCIIPTSKNDEGLKHGPSVFKNSKNQNIRINLLLKEKQTGVKHIEYAGRINLYNIL